MKYRLLITTFFVLSIVGAFAGTRTKEEMKEAAMSVLMKSSAARGTTKSNLSTDLKEYLTKEKLSIIGSEELGFAVVTSDDRFDEVIGYSTTSFTDSMPCGFKWWLDAVEETMENTENQVASSRANRVSVTGSVAPLLKTKWDQETPYNNSCTHNGMKLLTGCVATAMAQVMNYYQYPDRGIGSHSYTVNYSDWGTVTYSSNFEEHIYDWGNMLDSYTSGYSDKQASAVALLMRDCGISTNMTYRTYNSTAYTSAIANALKNYFSYSQSTYYLYRPNIDQETWLNKVYTELSNGHPICYAGSPTSAGTTGHAFVLDGYDKTGKVHVNWGWSGSFDGYYSIDALNPGTNNYSYAQEMVVAIPGPQKTSYTLTYYVDEVVYKSYDITVGEVITPESAPVKEGYTFSGWSEIPSTMPNHNVYVYGSFISSNNIDGHDYVDLGLPSGMVWAATNYGSNSESSYGTYVSWNSNDVVSQNWGSKWKTPTRANYQELINNCIWTWESKNGINGYRVTGKNGSSIFMPAAGFQILGNNQMVGSQLYYWTSNQGNESGFAYCLNGNSSSYNVDVTYNTSVVTCPIRLVAQKPAVVEEKYEVKVTASGAGFVYIGTTSSSVHETTKTYEVLKGSSTTLRFSPNSGYRVKSVKVNNADVTSSVSDNKYTISNISKNTTVSVTFEAIPVTTYTLSITSTGSGYITYSGNTIGGTTKDYTINEGASATLTFTPNNGYRVKIVKVNNVDVSSSVSNNTYTIGNISQNTTVHITFEAISVTSGDVNNDGSVSVTDVGCVINYILEQVPSTFIIAAADMNKDGEISVTDVGIIINLILSGEASSRSGIPQAMPLNAQMGLLPMAVGYQLILGNMDAFIGFQFDVESTTLDDIQLMGGYDHLIICRQLSNGKYRVVCYSPTNSAFNNIDSGNYLLKMSSTDDVVISNIRLTTSNFGELHPSALSGTTTGIATIGDCLQISVQDGTLHIISDRDTVIRVYFLGGSVYRTLDVRRGTNVFDGMRAGVYMIENNKIILR